MIRIIAATLVATFCLWAAAPVKTAAPMKPSTPVKAASAKSDAQIEAAIKAKLAKSKIGADGFAVRVQGGIAHWSGATNVLQHKGAATRMAKSAGAVGVVNEIKVSEAARAKAAGNLDTGRRRVQIKRGDERTEKR